MTSCFFEDLNHLDSDFINSVTFAKVKSFLCPYYKGGLPDLLFKMSEDEANRWFKENRIVDLPEFTLNIQSQGVLTLSQAIKYECHGKGDVCVEYGDGTDSMIGCSGMANFVYEVLQAVFFGYKFFLD